MVDVPGTGNQTLDPRNPSTDGRKHFELQFKSLAWNEIRLKVVEIATTIFAVQNHFLFSFQ